MALAESGCVVRLENRTYSLPAENAAVEAHLARLKERERGVRIEVEGDAPYRCVGSTVFAAQRIGLRVSLTAEPPR